MKVQQLNKIDVTRYPIGHRIYGWLGRGGFHVKIQGDRLFMVRYAESGLKE